MPPNVGLQKIQCLGPCPLAQDQSGQKEGSTREEGLQPETPGYWAVRVGPQLSQAGLWLDEGLGSSGTCRVSGPGRLGSE